MTTKDLNKIEDGWTQAETGDELDQADWATKNAHDLIAELRRFYPRPVELLPREAARAEHAAREVAQHGEQEDGNYTKVLAYKNGHLTVWASTRGTRPVTVKYQDDAGCEQGAELPYAGRFLYHGSNAGLQAEIFLRGPWLEFLEKTAAELREKSEHEQRQQAEANAAKTNARFGITNI